MEKNFRFFVGVGVLAFSNWGTGIFGSGMQHFCTQDKSLNLCDFAAI
jgi:hypothetical protein